MKRENEALVDQLCEVSKKVVLVETELKETDGKIKLLMEELKKQKLLTVELESQLDEYKSTQTSQ